MKAFNHRQCEAINRLNQTNDFQELIEYLESSLVEIKDNLIIANEYEISKLQGTGMFLDKLLKDIKSTSK